MARILTAAQQGRYHGEGIVFPIPVLTPDESRYFRSACDALEMQLGGRPRTVEVRQMHLHFPWAYELATHPRVLDVAEDVLGQDLVVWASELFAKHPRDAAVSIGWHRDRTYLEFDPQATVTAWIALSPCTAENGCMCVVMERERQRATTWRTQGSGSRHRESRSPDVPPESIRPVILEAGEMSLHDVHVLHGSGPNHSGAKRVGFAIRFVTPAAIPRADRPPAILARGHDQFGHFQWIDPPPQADSQHALAGMQRSARRHLELTLENVKQAAR